MKYDYLVVGSGLFGAIFAYEANKRGKKCLVIDKREHVAGNIYTENIDGINVHKYGAHIFHTSNKDVWDYIQQFAEFNRYTNSPVARYKDELYNLPFNLNTFSRMFNLITPQDIESKLNEERKEGLAKLNGKEPSNLEEQAISLVGTTVYEKLIKGYTEKQWGMLCTELPTFIIKRLPVRMIYDNNYFNDKYQGIPIGGYTRLVERMLEGIELRLNTNFFDDVNYYKSIANKIVYTGPIDEYFDYCLGTLDWRSLRFDTKVFDMKNYQGNAVVNYTGHEVDYTRVIEHKHFEFDTESEKTVVTFEYPVDYEEGMEKYYTVNDDKNNALAEKYRELASKEKNVIFGGRLAEYKYYDMDDVIYNALKVEI